jgi:hypothetical protein
MESLYRRSERSHGLDARNDFRTGIPYVLQSLRLMPDAPQSHRFRRRHRSRLEIGDRVEFARLEIRAIRSLLSKREMKADNILLRSSTNRNTIKMTVSGHNEFKIAFANSDSVGDGVPKYPTRATPTMIVIMTETIITAMGPAAILSMKAPIRVC